ncbi:MAG: hypothetical protein C0622_14335 [Desulfuromonas sp.]|nr:MAG: hypothetical protein C0622_14335 [Desulfuromonas sp.]
MLRDKLNEMKAASAAKVPPETLAIMMKAKADLAASGIMEKAIKPGDRVADFSLADAGGKMVSFAALRQQGPVLISVYRGVW